MRIPVGAYTHNVERCVRSTPVRRTPHSTDGREGRDFHHADTGMCRVWTARFIDPSASSSLLHGSMANAYPMALGAPGCYDRQVVSVSGDGGLSMLLGELITADNDLPVKVVMLYSNAQHGRVGVRRRPDG